uniref:Uncharacterized protein n=1 Tax=Anolis carolinensis TaxID=28377 RepID=A0A803TKL5_ANOCA
CVHLHQACNTPERRADTALWALTSGPPHCPYTLGIRNSSPTRSYAKKTREEGMQQLRALWSALSHCILTIRPQSKKLFPCLSYTVELMQFDST